MTFANIEYFLLLLLLVPFFLWHFLWRHKSTPTIRTATTQQFSSAPHTLRLSLIHLPFVLRMLAFVAIVIVLARPQTQNSLHERETEGIDIVMAMDISTSMLTPDLQPNRIEAAKAVAYEFINNRPDDNIGLTLFGGEAFTQCPLTTDHAALLSMFRTVTCSYQEQGIISAGTAIGMGLANAVAHLEGSKAKSKVVILLTDGVNNTGEISPMMAADMAKKCGIRIYTIAVGGSMGKTRQAVAILPNGEQYMADLDNTSDPETLRNIASATGGIFYQADSRKKLSEIYQDIDKLEKTKLKVLNYDRRYEAYQLFGVIAFCLLALEVLLRLTIFRRLA